MFDGTNLKQALVTFKHTVHFSDNTAPVDLKTEYNVIIIRE